MSPLVNPRSPRLRRLLRPTLAAMLAVAFVACEAEGPLPPRPGRPAALDGGGSTTVNSLLVGTWQRVFVFVDEFGFAHSSETTWEFRADGFAVRTMVTRNLTLGLSDVTVTTAQWTIDGTDLVLEFNPPNAGQVILEFSIVDDELTLGGELYNRIGDG